MPRTVQVIRTCENHPDRPASDEEIPPVTWGRARPMVFDACDECVHMIVEPFFDLLTKGVPEPSAVPVGKPNGRGSGAPDEEPVQCPLCEAVAKGRQNLSKHLRTMHGKGIRQLRAEGVDV